MGGIAGGRAGTAGDRAAPPEPDDPRQIGGYEVVGRLGEGGMGRVFLARTAAGRLAAVKLIHPELARDEGFRRRFRSEMARARQVPPFCTAEVLDADADHDPPYLVVEYVDGPSLEDAVTRDGPLSAANAYAVALNMATALTAIHGAGIVHGDLKPANVLLAPGSPKVIDFGLARPADTPVMDVTPKRLVGTVPYMAPEQFTADGVRTRASDVFAWASVVVFAATGRTPFPGDKAVDIAMRIANDPPELGGLTGSLRSLVEDAFAKDPEDRPSARQLRDRLSVQSGAVRSPYQGLTAYQESDADLFFGREELTATLSRRLADRLTGVGLMVVLGASGSGKSSLLQAGLLASLRDHLPGAAGSRDWPRIRFTPGRYPLRELAANVAELARVPGGAMHDELVADPHRFPVHVLQALRASAAPEIPPGAEPDDPKPHRPRPRLILVVDQFEELFTVCEQERERQAFIDALRAAAGADEHDQTALVVLGVRADFYARCATYSALAPLLEQNTTVGPMSPAELRRAITEPARRTGLTLEPGLVEVLLRDIGADVFGEPSGPANSYPSGALPLLSHALRATWTRRQDEMLTLAGYRATGGVQGALASTAEALYTGLDGVERGALRRLLLRLVRIGEDGTSTRQRVSIAELTAGPHIEQPVTGAGEGGVGPETGPEAGVGEAGTTAGLLDRLADERLVSLGRENAELTHEALLRAWPRLRQWVDEDRAGLLVRQQLIDAARAWERERRDLGGLYRGARLGLARDHLDAGHEHELPPNAQAFLRASIEAEVAEQHALRRRARRRVALIAILSVLLAGTATAAVIAVQQRSTAIAQQRDATARAIAFEAESLRQTEPAQALRLGAAALRISPNADIRGSLVQTLVGNRYAGTLTGLESLNVALSDSGDLAVASSRNGAEVWDLRTPASPRRVSALTGDRAGGAAWLAVTPDGRTAITADREAAVWDLADPARPRRTATFLTGTGGGGPVAVTSDGRTAIVGGDDGGTATVWDLSAPGGPRRTATLAGHSGLYVAVAISGDGHTGLTVGSFDRTPVVWDLSRRGAPRRVVELAGHTSSVSSVALSQNGRVAMTGSNGGAAIVWDVRSGRELARLTAHSSQVLDVDLNRGGTLGLTGSRDGTAMLWDLRTPTGPRSMATLTTRTGAVSAVALAGRGPTVVTAAGDGTATAWDVNTFPERRAVGWLDGHGGAVHSVAVRPDGLAALTGAFEGEARLWDLKDPAAPRQTGTLAGHSGDVCSLGWRPDGTAAATVDRRGTTRVWDTRDAVPRVVAVLAGPTSARCPLAWSSDGRALLTHGTDGALAVWNMSDPADPVRVGTLAGIDGEVASVGWSPTGRIALTGSTRGQVASWDLRDPAKPRRLAALTRPGEAGPVAWSPDGRSALTGTPDGRTILWDLTEPARVRQVTVLAGHAGGVHSVAWGREGHTAVTGGEDGTAILWDLTAATTPRRLLTFTDHTGYVLAAAMSPDGRLMITGGADHDAIVYDIVDITEMVRDPAARACAIAGRGLSEQEWAHHARGLPYQRTCPG